MVQVGEHVPDFTLASTEGKEVSLSNFRGKNVVLYFYPKDNTPGCTTESCDFRDAYEQFQNLNTVILGISRDSIKSHEKFIEKYQLPFALLSDPDAKVCEQFGVYKEKTMFGKKAMGIERSTFVLDQEGKLVKEYRKVKVKDHVQEALRYVEEHLA
ncbi:thioredoxin-dependent thiol peroxidase [Risungbinella massiliensis]|uniref:thioredoxin-dependent thiol peroxidase n=1 Tax=Risungbinella massiliensis TaxID=1329796 RepID=UPI0005CC4820|nr:thioredoxin-dependent thiol peroxidase [Risungbinella massiliensis]